jgi:hypothetical protein
MTTDNYTEAEAEALAKFQEIRAANQVAPDFRRSIERNKGLVQVNRIGDKLIPWEIRVRTKI